MNAKEKLKNNIVIKLSTLGIDKVALSVINNIIDNELQTVEVTNKEVQLPMVVNDENEQIIKLFMCTKATKLSKKTVKQYLYTVSKLLNFTNKPLTKIDSFDIECFLNSISNTNGNSSLNSQRRYLSALYTWMRKQHIITENPVEAIDCYKEIVKPIDHMEAEDYEQLKSGCKTTRDRCIIEFLRSTAIRVGEIEKVKVSDVDWNNGSLSIFGEKTNEYRLVCLDSIAIKYLKQYLAERGITQNSNESLFVTKQNKPIKRESIRGILNKIAKYACVERRIYPHLFRKTTATNIVKRGGSVRDAGDYLGHKDRSTTGKHYTYLGDKYIRSIFDRYVATI